MYGCPETQGDLSLRIPWLLRRNRVSIPSTSVVMQKSKTNRTQGRVESIPGQMCCFEALQGFDRQIQFPRGLRGDNRPLALRRS